MEWTRRRFGQPSKRFCGGNDKKVTFATKVTFKSMIKKIKGKYVVLSEKTGWPFGTYKTKAEAEVRLRQIEFFKHLKGKKKRK